MEMSHKDFIFSCGGSIPILLDKHSDSHSQSSESDSGAGQNAIVHEPVTLRWDPHDASATVSSHRKLTFPLGADVNSQATLDGLIADMAPASFGRGGEDVYDETYRKALKLDPSRFSTNFSPYTSGIVDAIAQMLLPSYRIGSKRGVKAELYKLNVSRCSTMVRVYEGPSGHFRSHVDTPRSASQFGSLVVCLPVPHEGGQLEVRHETESVTFDWSGASTDPPTIEWAAFYSDCEHEVLQVRAGHRVTLTYNLYTVHGQGHLAGNPNAIDSLQLPFYKKMDGILNQKEFMSEGGWLGFFTTHAYPHASKQFERDTLKGIDMAIWQGFQALGCGVCLRPIVDYKKVPDPGDRIIGKYFPAVCVDGMVEDEDHVREVAEGWGVEGIDPADIQWVNDGGNQELQFAYTAYGNEASTTASYSRCAILVGVPPYGENGRMMLETTFEEREVDWEGHSHTDMELLGAF
ncbi:hypothetical protein GQ53DRAFT_701013 [Thozetella sp. PMI_491]|nr:hypothetical protein GQ53DRAFT_701013 [Thozetella sp. PMI_491]